SSGAPCATRQKNPPPAPPGSAAPANAMKIEGEVESLLYLGANTRFDIRLPGGGHLAVMQQNRDTHFAPEQGNKVTLWWDKRHLMTFGGGGGCSRPLFCVSP